MALVCHCNGLSDDDVKAAHRHGASAPRHVYAHFSCYQQCGRCVEWMQHMLDQSPLAKPHTLTEHHPAASPVKKIKSRKRRASVSTSPIQPIRRPWWKIW